MSTPTAVGIDDDLTAGETGVALWTSDDEEAARLQVVDGVVVQVLGWHDKLDDLLHQILANLLQSDLGRVLHRDDDGVHSQWDAGAVADSVLDSDLGLGVRSGPWNSTL